MNNKRNFNISNNSLNNAWDSRNTPKQSKFVHNPIFDPKSGTNVFVSGVNTATPSVKHLTNNNSLDSGFQSIDTNNNSSIVQKNCSDVLLRSFQLQNSQKFSATPENSVSKSQNITITPNDSNWSMLLPRRTPGLGATAPLENLATTALTRSKLINYTPQQHRKLENFEKIDWKNPVFGVNSQLNIPSMSNSKVMCRRSFDKLFNTFSFNKPMLESAHVFGQVDNKFICCRLDNMLVLVDQHAAHERIRLEKLLKRIGYYEAAACKKKIKSQVTRLIPPAKIMLSENELSTVKTYQRQFEEVGLYVSVSNAITVRSVPSVFVNACEFQPQVSGHTVNANLLQEFIFEQCQALRATDRCNVSTSALFKVMASYACHGAIKFGDKLLLEKCHEIMANLQHCNLPFQCAHGRPSIAPLVMLTNVRDMLDKESVNKPNLARLGTLMKKC